MKYIDADKLIANLERQNVDKKVIESLIRIITSLQQEQQEVDLKKEIKRYIKSCEGAKNVNGHIFELDWNGITAIIDEAARHFAEWQKEQPKVILLKRDTEDIFAREYAIYSLPPFVVESIAYGTQLIDFIYKTAHHFYGRGFRRAAEMYDEIEYNRQRAEED